MKIAEWEVVYSAMSGQPELFCRTHTGEYVVYGDEVGAHGSHAMVSVILRGMVD
jgi:hypothetical protein